MNPPKLTDPSDGQKESSIADRVIELYKHVIGSDQPEAAQFADKLFQAYGLALRHIRRAKAAERQAAKVAINKRSK